MNLTTEIMEDFLLPETDSVEECGCFDDDNLPTLDMPRSRGIFSESPERAARWIEEASLHFSR